MGPLPSYRSKTGLEKSVKLLIPPDGQLQMQGSNPLHLQILTCIASQLQNLKRLLLLDKLIWQEGFLITLSHPKLINSKSIETVTLFTCITSILNNYTGYMDKLQHLYTPRNCNSPYSIAKESYYSRYNTLSELPSVSPVPSAQWIWAR